jgi:hypothetical protein
MFQLPKLPFFNPLSLLGSRSIRLPSVKIEDIETSSDRRARTLKHLLKANHANFSIIYNNLRFHNHTPHILGSAYLLGSTGEHLNDVYDAESKHHDLWQDAPGEVTGGDWREYLGKKEYVFNYLQCAKENGFLCCCSVLMLLKVSAGFHRLLRG